MLHEFRFALRGLRKAPGFTVVAVVTLALAIGANTAIFSVADAVLFRPLPYGDPDRVFILRMLNRETGTRYTRISSEFVRVIDEHHRGLSTVGQLDAESALRVSTIDGTEALGRVAVTTNYFDVLGVRPLRGRFFEIRDLTQPGRAAILTYGAWQKRFGGDESVVGRPTTIGGTAVDVIGILPKNFVFPSAFAGGAELITATEPVWRQGPGGTFHPIVRLESGVTRAQAQAEVDALVAPLIAADSRLEKTGLVLDEVRFSAVSRGTADHASSADRRAARAAPGLREPGQHAPGTHASSRARYGRARGVGRQSGAAGRSAHLRGAHHRPGRCRAGVSRDPGGLRRPSASGAAGRVR